MEYNITDHGVENSQYFQGHGTSLTEWEDCATGVGDSYWSAFEDALDMLAQSWPENSEEETFLDRIQNEHEKELRDSGQWEEAQVDKVTEVIEENLEPGESVDDDMECDLYYYVSIDIKR